MKILLLVAGLCVTTFAFSQNKYLKIKNLKNDSWVYFQQNERVRIKTQSGNKLIGNLKILDNQYIAVGDITLVLNDIFKIKKYPVKAKIMSSVLFLGMAGYLGYTSAIILFLGSAAALIPATVSAAFFYLAFSPANFHRNFKAKPHMVFEVIEKYE